MCVFTECCELKGVDKGMKERVAIKVYKVIDSCKTLEQCLVAKKYLILYETLYLKGHHRPLRDLWDTKFSRISDW